MYTCQFCDKQTTNPGANKKHEITCNSNPNKLEKCGGRKKGSIPWNKGKTKETDKSMQQMSESLKTRYKNTNHYWLGKTHSELSKQKMRENINKRYADGWECKAGRCPKYDYESPIAGNIKVDGSWELLFCKWADKKKLNWKRNKKRFDYIKDTGKPATYQPDFYIKELDSYIEVKGYETDLDKIKWNQFPKKLLIIRRKEIGELDEWFKSVTC